MRRCRVVLQFFLVLVVLGLLAAGADAAGADRGSVLPTSTDTTTTSNTTTPPPPCPSECTKPCETRCAPCATACVPPCPQQCQPTCASCPAVPSQAKSESPPEDSADRDSDNKEKEASKTEEGASSNDTVDTATFLSWATGSGSIDWFEGIALAALGLIGALVTVYFLLGDFLPSMGGKVRVAKMEADRDVVLALLNASMARREKQIAKGAVDKEVLAGEERLTSDYADRLAQLHQAITSERRSLLSVGIPAYLLLGAFFATAFATNLLQAVLVGAGWTLFADRLGLAKETPVREEIRTDEVAVFKKAADEAKAAEQAEGAAKEQVKRTVDALAAQLTQRQQPAPPVTPDSGATPSDDASG